ncbi:MAG: sugar phosphate nucleotidyltransferase, partial [Candidatus Omnitrophota bacterium]
MNNAFSYALILAGGKGIRLWPKSKEISPKHTLFFRSKKSLLAKTFMRLKNFFSLENIFVVTLTGQEKLVRKQIAILPEENFILEPFGKNTLPAILSGTIFIKERNPQAKIFVFPSDQFLEPRDKFLSALQQASDFLEEHNGIV